MAVSLSSLSLILLRKRLILGEFGHSKVYLKTLEED
ncbi:hypothetical protein F383_13231 [Gossypium arboreum]|uniref:Uncharacterized protein n=1 Tax=Gossypium arboreum TaxID=29729 RepID=A0A0B0PRS7_GOSAR|nr:hypothetical protein F383_13231 [Gossypium arboreum]